MAAILTFARAVFWGSMLGGGLFMLLTVPLAIIYFDWERPVDSLWIAIMPFVLAASIVVPSAAFLGLPLTGLLAYLKRESHSTYVHAGLGLGALLPIGFGHYLDAGASGVFFSLPGALAGSVTAAIWGDWREDRTGRSADATGQ